MLNEIYELNQTQSHKYESNIEKYHLAQTYHESSIAPFTTVEVNPNGEMVRCIHKYPKSVNTIKSYYFGKSKAMNQTMLLKTYFQRLMNMYKGCTLKFHLCKFMITGNTSNYHWSNNNYGKVLTVNDKNVLKNFNHGMKLFRRNIINHDKYTKMLFTHAVTKFPNDFHVHGLLVFISTPKHQVNIAYIAKKNHQYTNYLSNALGYNINIAPNTNTITTLNDFANHNNSPVVIDKNNINSSTFSTNVSTYLTYIYKTQKLQFINSTEDSERWNQLSIHQQNTYISGVPNTSRKHIMNGKWVYPVRKVAVINPVTDEVSIHKIPLKPYKKCFVGIPTYYTNTSINYTINQNVQLFFMKVMYYYSLVVANAEIESVVQAWVHKIVLLRFLFNKYDYQPSLFDASKYTQEYTSKHYYNLSAWIKLIHQQRVLGMSSINDNKELPAPALTFSRKVPKETHWIPLRVNLNISLKIVNKKLALFNSS